MRKLYRIISNIGAPPINNSNAKRTSLVCIIIILRIGTLLERQRALAYIGAAPKRRFTITMTQGHATLTINDIIIINIIIYIIIYI